MSDRFTSRHLGFSMGKLARWTWVPTPWEATVGRALDAGTPVGAVLANPTPPFMMARWEHGLPGVAIPTVQAMARTHTNPDRGQVLEGLIRAQQQQLQATVLESTARAVLLGQPAVYARFRFDLLLEGVGVLACSSRLWVIFARSGMAYSLTGSGPEDPRVPWEDDLEVMIGTASLA